MSGFKVEFSILNLRATPGIYADALASRPAAGYPGRVFIDTDNPSTGMYRDTGTVWVQIAETATSDVDTLQNVTDNGNTTTNSITVGAATTPAGTIDVRRATAALNNATDYGIVAISSPTIPNGAIFGVNNVNAIAGSEVLTFAGSATIGNSGLNSAGIFTNVLTSTGAGTVTVGQGSTLRSISGLQSVVYYNTAAATTFTHVAAIKTTQPINSGAAAASVTNNYGIIVADNTASSGTITYTNRWGIYQEGASDKNYFAANVLIKSTTDNGNALQVTGQANFTGNVGIGTTSPAAKLQVIGDIATSTRVVTDLINGYTGGSTPLTIQTGGTQSIIFGTNATERMRITSGGNVGIGTTSPTPYTAGSLVFNQLSSNANSEIKLTNSTTGNASAAGLLIAEYSNDAYLWNGSNGILAFGTNNSERMRITSAGELLINTTTDVGDFKLQVSGNAYVSGNVGISTTSPNVPLEVNGSIRTTRSGVASQYLQLEGGDATGSFITAVGVAKILTIRNNSTTSSDINFDQAVATGYNFKQAGNTKMVIDGSGSVGINTTSPNAVSLLQMDSTTKGFLLPRMTDAQINAISNPPDGLMVYSTDQHHIAFYDAGTTSWKKVNNSNL